MQQNRTGSARRTRVVWRSARTSPTLSEREKFEADAEAFCLSEILKAERKEAGLTQEQLAERIGTKKTITVR